MLFKWLPGHRQLWKCECLFVAHNCCVARMLPGEAELVSEWTGLPGRAKSVKRFERSNGLDTALYKTTFSLYLPCEYEGTKLRQPFSQPMQFEWNRPTRDGQEFTSEEWNSEGNSAMFMFCMQTQWSNDNRRQYLIYTCLFMFTRLSNPCGECSTRMRNWCRKENNCRMWVWSIAQSQLTASFIIQEWPPEGAQLDSWLAP